MAAFSVETLRAMSVTTFASTARAAVCAAIAACARDALASGDAFGHARTAVRETAAGWSAMPLARHDPLAQPVAEPVLMQLVGSDGAGADASRSAVATLGSVGWLPRVRCC